MTDWFRSAAVLGAAFVGVAVLTVGLATFIVPGLALTPPATSGGQSGATAQPPFLGIPGLGGDLAVTGDREGTFRLTREANDEQYALVGDQGRIVFEGRPVEITQLSFEGLEFFPEAEDCTITPDDLDDQVGIGRGELRCENLADIRGNGTISIEGTIGLPLDMLAESELPESGGTVEVGDETWEFAEAILLGFARPAVAGDSVYSMELEDRKRGAVVNFAYDFETHRLSLASVERDGQASDVPDDACELREEEIGMHNPRTSVIELSIRCPEVDVPGLGLVAISGTLIVDRIESPS